MDILWGGPARVLVGSMLIPSADTMWPRNSTCLAKNLHLVNFSVRLLSCNICNCNTWDMWLRCLVSFEEWINLSSMKTSTKFRWPNIRVTSLWKTLGLLLSN